MCHAPFRLCFFYSANRILIFGGNCKCAIFSSALSLQGHDCTGDFRQAHLRNIPGGSTKGIEGLRRVEVQYTAKIIIRKVFAGVNATSGQKHIADTVLQSITVCDLHIQIVQFFQKAVFLVVMQLGKIVGHVILYGILRRREKRRR